MKYKPLVLIILDGWGINPRRDGNAILLANIPIWNKISATYPMTSLQASGLDVGLPAGVMGNSEVGHTNIGAGRVVWQEITRIDRSIEDGSFFRIKSFVDAISNIKNTGGKLHLMGLVSDGSVHSVDRHYFAIIDLAKHYNVPSDKLVFHCFTDGRDTPPNSGIGYVKALIEKMGKMGIGKIGTISGRYWAMDRDKRWNRVKKTYDAMVLGIGIRSSLDPIQAIEEAYNLGETDEFIKPVVIIDTKSNPVGTIKDGDSVIFFNFRADRGRELTMAFTKNDFSEFERKVVPKVFFTTMTKYHDNFTLPVAFEPVTLTGTFGEIISQKGLKQLRIAETEKYAHVTFFFNGGISDTPFRGEDRILVPSPKVPTYDTKPEMSSTEVTNSFIAAIEKDIYDGVILNFANPDMVGHTGKLSAAIKAVEAVDRCLGKVLSAIKNKNGCALVTSDHGNCEQMIDYKTGEPHTYHTTNPVPFILVEDNLKSIKLRKNGALKDISPTMLELLDIEKPSQMEGESLFIGYN